MITSEIKALRTSITQKPPFCSGTIALLPEHEDLFYKRGIEANWIDMSQPSDHDLELLAKACDPATFGLDQRNVFDETYRKAGKMDTDKFSAKFNLKEARLIERLRTQLLSGLDEAKSIKSELYKLNVYGKDSFFKAHKDTPRSETMFASLVVVYPTPHEGGALLLRHGGKEWSFDSATAVCNHSGPSIAYVAFYSDVEHEVALVQSGYRVTLTYNLYFDDDDRLPPLPPTVVAIAPDDHVFESALVTALKNPTFLPNGGILGFGLAFTYPVSSSTVLKNLLACLKGSDAVIQRVCDRLSLDVSLRALYEDKTEEYSRIIMVDQIVDLNERQINDDDISISYVLRSWEWGFEGKPMYDYEEDVSEEDEDGEPIENDQRVIWITPLTGYMHCQTSYISPFAMGNEAGLCHIYGDVCLIVNVGPSDRRGTKNSSASKERNVKPPMPANSDSEGEDSREDGSLFGSEE